MALDVFATGEGNIGREYREGGSRVATEHPEQKYDWQEPFSNDVLFENIYI